MAARKSRQTRGRARVAASVLMPSTPPSMRAPTPGEQLWDQLRTLLAGRTAEERSDAAGALLGETFGTPASITSGIRDVAEAVRTGQPISEDGALRVTRPVPLSEADNMARASQLLATRPGSLAAMRQAAGDLLEMGGGFAPTTPSDVLFPLAGKLAAGAKAVAAGAKGTSLAALPFAIGSQGWKDARAAIRAKQALDASVGAVPGMPGFYSRLERAVLELPEQGVPADQLLRRLRKSREGISTDELALRNVPAFLEARQGQTITPADLQAHLDANPIPFVRYRSQRSFALPTRSTSEDLPGINPDTGVPFRRFDDKFTRYTVGDSTMSGGLVNPDFTPQGTSVIGYPKRFELVAGRWPKAKALQHYGTALDQVEGGPPVLHVRQSIAPAGSEAISDDTRSLLENVQSDWLQYGRKHGFQSPATVAKARQQIEQSQDALNTAQTSLQNEIPTFVARAQEGLAQVGVADLLEQYAEANNLSLQDAAQALLMPAPKSVWVPDEEALLKGAARSRGYNEEAMRDIVKEENLTPYEAFARYGLATEHLGVSQRLRNRGIYTPSGWSPISPGNTAFDALLTENSVNRQWPTPMMEAQRMRMQNQDAVHLQPSNEYAQNLDTLLADEFFRRPEDPVLNAAARVGPAQLRDIVDNPLHAFREPNSLRHSILNPQYERGGLVWTMDDWNKAAQPVKSAEEALSAAQTQLNKVQESLPTTGLEEAWPTIGVKEAILQNAELPGTTIMGVTPSSLLRARGEAIGDKFQNKQLPGILRKVLHPFERWGATEARATLPITSLKGREQAEAVLLGNVTSSSAPSSPATLQFPYQEFTLTPEVKNQIRLRGLPFLSVLGAAGLGGWRSPLFEGVTPSRKETR